MKKILEELESVRIRLKANVYFGGKVISHGLWTADGQRKSVGTIAPGTYHFDTEAPERMEILSGLCRVLQTGQTEWRPYGAGEAFDVPAKSSFDITVDEGLAEYLCSFGRS